MSRLPAAFALPSVSKALNCIRDPLPNLYSIGLAIHESDILNQDFRKKVIDEINGPENQSRKAEMYKRYEIYRDYTKKYVAQAVKDEQGIAAYKDVLFRTTNISICKSIINKKAVLYVNGVRREVIGDEVAQWQIDQVCDLLNINSVPIS